MTSFASDPTSLANPLDVKVLSSHLALTVDFSKKILAGYVDHQTEVLKDGSSTLVLDSKSLTIKKVSIVKPSEEEVTFNLGKTSDVFGVPVEIPIPANLRSAGSKFTARVHYETSNASSALQWLEPRQTAGKAHPYLFSQCQAIHARSMVPCQDTPSNKIKYTAAITVDSPLTALMSATPTGQPTTSDSAITYNFVQDVPIPTYLIAIAVGHLESREVGPRSKVWSEPEMVEKGAYEFANTEKFIKIGEDLLTPYVWGRYDILLLPPSFPYGGMENPQLTFVTPTLLAGDRSLENVVAHEIAHSWMGNLVTNRFWSEFFLNEGFTVFVERKILGRLTGNPEYFDFEALGGLKHLQDDIDHFGESNPLTALRPKMDGIDPDDSFSSVPYEKGFNLLCYLQSLVGVERFEQWLKAYVTKFQYQSITADQMKEFFLSSFTDVSELNKIDWDSWFDKPGMPIVCNHFSTKLADTAIALAKRWVEQGAKGSNADELKDFTPGQKLTFLDQLSTLATEPLSKQVIEDLDKTYNFTPSKNAEIRLRWYTLCIKANHTPIFPHVVEFLTEQGRMKFVRPLYRELHKNEEGKKLAEDTFKAHRGSYHSIAARQLAKDLNISE